jgi:hypothetical protein
MFGSQDLGQYSPSMLETDWKKNQAKLILCTALSCLLIGRAWQHLFWDAPFRTLFWNEEFLKSFIESTFNLSWHEYVTHPFVDKGIQLIVKLFGLFYTIGIFVTWKYKSDKKCTGLYLVLLSCSLLFLAILETIEKFLYIGMFLEHVIQFSTPIIAYYFYTNKKLLFKKIIILKLIIACTFIGHGLFALGLHPVPGNFIDMFVIVFGASEETARLCLKIAGSFDILASILLFIPRFTQKTLYMMVCWGGLTGLARILAHLDFQLIVFSGHQWILEFFVRIPHALIPLFLLTLLKENEKI